MAIEFLIPMAALSSHSISCGDPAKEDKQGGYNPKDELNKDENHEDELNKEGISFPFILLVSSN